MNYRVEKFYPYVVGPCAGILAYIFLKAGWATVPGAIKELFAAVVNVSAITVGFLGAVKSILFTIDGRPIIRKMKRANYFAPLIAFLMQAIYLSFSLAIFTGALLLSDPKSPPYLFKSILSLWVAVLITAMAASYRIIRTMGGILRIVAEEQPAQDEPAPSAPTTPIA